MKHNVTRTLKKAIDLDTMQAITSDALLSYNRDQYIFIRHEATKRRQSGKPRYVCAHCGYDVYAPLEPSKSLPYWRHFKGAPADCPWSTGDPDSINRVSAKQFDGSQESPLHHKLKHLVADILASDPTASDIHVERTIMGKNGRRRPDIQATWQGRKIAFEIQLATTQIPIILSRERFYENEGMFLIWLTWNFEMRPIEKVSQPILDIHYRHHKNLFSLDEETIALSKAQEMLVFRVFSYGYNSWDSDLSALDKLTWPESGLPYAFSAPQSWAQDYRKRWLEKIRPEGMHWQNQQDLLTELIDILEFDLPHYELQAQYIPELINMVFSLECGHTVDSAQPNLFAFANSFLAAQGRHAYAETFEFFARKFGRQELLQRDSVGDKLQKAKTTEQMRKGSIPSQIIRLVFEDWLNPA